MKRLHAREVVLLFTIGLLSIILVSCAATTNTAEASSDSPFSVSGNINGYNEFGFYADKETGCEYIVVRGGGIDAGITTTPRIAEDGKSHKGCKGVSR